MYIYIRILIYYNTAMKGSTDIYARHQRVRSALGRVHIYITQIPSKLYYNIYILLCKGLTHKKMKNPLAAMATVVSCCVSHFPS